VLGASYPVAPPTSGCQAPPAIRRIAYRRSFLIRQIPVAAWTCGRKPADHERSAMQHTISRRGAFRTQTLIAYRAAHPGKMANRERDLRFPLIWINVK
jgi:hypothetical protein